MFSGAIRAVLPEMRGQSPPSSRGMEWGAWGEASEEMPLEPGAALLPTPLLHMRHLMIYEEFPPELPC